jgi:hypothetical protein
MLRNKINSDLETLDKLNLIYPWIPNSLCIRPKLEDIDKKNNLIQEINLKWVNHKDYIYNKIFGHKYYINNEFKKFIKYNFLKYENIWSFQPSLFKYNIILESNHWILWNCEKDFNFDFPEEEINEIISKYLHNLILNDNYQFVWYKNPKPSITDFFHIQVFWINFSK